MASERGPAQTEKHAFRGCRAVHREVKKVKVSRIGMERPGIEGNTPVDENLDSSVRYLSKAGHEKPCLNPGRPLSKAKYSVVTDSERVP